ncbi:hypothetical protein ASPZODRAFT_155082 [Penicilliopsis zonata CBS 506.65]|uniref:LIM zinc-binding domain-containing protein n=1 Tax=Penicilliopsis zonata CBS 506.65 TaxID=1073090 RepID=A0A1L9S6Q2_9EURO|nr:hypothetical protein ASPZODRAFT_155082 [Penicilliopsis zonata CBS 506.65]OJJ42830.1 hypothetical protein ASPZODRAFT_155082 [Penicilliopsis zonata CBS 506.65]
MADFMEGGSFLPTIKCSSCGVDVEISAMGDHVCSPLAAPLQPPPLRITTTRSSPFRSPSPSPISTGTTESDLASRFPSPPSTAPSPGRFGPPPRIDPAAANRPFLRPDVNAPSSNISHSISPLSAAVRSPYGPLQRSQTTPLPGGPISPELTNLDCAFPPFPTARSRSGTRSGRRSPLPDTVPPPLPEGVSRSASPAFTLPAPPQSESGNTYGSPPSFSSLRGPVSHRREFSIDSKSSYRTSLASTRYGDTGSRPSTSHSHRPSLASVTKGPQSWLDDAPPLPPAPLGILRSQSPANSMLTTITSTDEQHGKGNTYSGFDFGISLGGQRSPNGETAELNTFRVSHNPSEGLSSRGSAELFLGTPSPGLSIPASDLADLAFEHSRESNSTSHGSVTYKAFRPTDHLQPTSTTTTTTSTQQPQPEAEDETLSMSNLAQALGLDTENGTASTISSDSSSPSGTHSGGSSVSSLLSEASLSRRKISESGRLGAVNEEASFSSQQNKPRSEADDEAIHTESPVELAPPRIPDPLFASPDSPTDPAIMSRGVGGLSLLPERRPPPAPSSPPASPSPPLHSSSPSSPPQERSSPPIRPLMTRAATTPLTKPVRSKGRCRGCSEMIMGKSVSSADGRLSGRYHKACFVCHHCRAPFQTADFYVLNDRPYCGPHYHELNGSLCVACGNGIEGQYLETVGSSTSRRGSSQKFHPDCLQCHTCRIILRGDYFEWNGQVYCERDARRAAAATSPTARRRPAMPSSPLVQSHGYPDLAPGPHLRPGQRPGPGQRPWGGPERPPDSPGGRRYPERRTTKLMMI